MDWFCVEKIWWSWPLGWVKSNTHLDMFLKDASQISSLSQQHLRHSNWSATIFSRCEVSLGTTPHPVTVTTRIVTFLIGNPELNLHFWLLLGGGPRPKVSLYPLLRVRRVLRHLQELPGTVLRYGFLSQVVVEKGMGKPRKGKHTLRSKLKKM